MRVSETLAIAALLISIPLLSGCDTQSVASSDTETIEVTEIDSIDINALPPEIEGTVDTHELGPHGGHIVHMEPGDVRAEWVQLDEDNTVQVYLPNVKAPEKVVMTVAIKEGNSKDFPLNKDSKLGDNAFSLTSGELITAFKMKQQELVQVKMKVVAGEQTLSCGIEHVGCSCGNH